MAFVATQPLSTEQIENHLSQCECTRVSGANECRSCIFEWKRSQLVVKVNLGKQQKRREDEPTINYQLQMLMGLLKKETVAVSRENTENFTRLVASALSELDLKVKGVDQITVSEQFIN